MSDKQLAFEDMPRPVGEFILTQKDIQYMQKFDGAWFHYQDVCTLLQRYAASQPTPGMPSLDKPILTDEDVRAWEESETSRPPAGFEKIPFDPNRLKQMEGHEERAEKSWEEIQKRLSQPPAVKGIDATPFESNTERHSVTGLTTGEYELAFIPCASDDPRRIGAYQSTDGESEFSVRELHLPVEPKGAVWVKASDRLPKSWNRLCARFIHTKIPLCAPETWISENERAVQDIEWLDESPTAAGEQVFQERVSEFMTACFGSEIPYDVTERNHRFLEESLELVQSTGCTASEAHQLVDYVFNRPVGEIPQEVGGVMVTLAALCSAAKLDMNKAGETELKRVWGKIEVIRAKQAAKPKHSPLPLATAAGDGKEAIEFADWIAVQGYRHLDNGVWAQEGIVNSLTTTAQLSDIFKNRNK